MTVNASNTIRNVIPPGERLLISEDDGATMLGVSKSMFRRWVDDDLITPVELPRGVRRRLYRRSDLERFAAGLAAGR